MSETADKEDLYELLGVPRTATSVEIGRAFKAKAPVYHPDNQETGDAQKFQGILRARRTLQNARTREIYDSVGVVEDEKADNDDAAMLGQLAGMFGSTMNAILKINAEPVEGDFLKAMQESITHNFDGLTKQIIQLENSRAKLAPMAGRFRVKSLEQPNHMESIVRGQLELIDRQIGQAKAQLGMLERCRVYLYDVSFRQGAQ